MPISHVAGFDDAPFARSHRGGVLVVGAVHSGTRLEGIVTGRVRRDGADATRVLAAPVREVIPTRTGPAAERDTFLLVGTTKEEVPIGSAIRVFPRPPDPA